MIKTAVIPSAGFGTRMLPATKAIPKEMLPVAGKPLIQYAIEEAAASGIETIILIVRSQKSLVQLHFDADPALELFLESRQLSTVAKEIRHLKAIANLKYVQQHQPCGLAHAICCARHLLEDEPFVVLLPDVVMVNDDPVTLQMIRTHRDYGGSVVAIREVAPLEVDRHGIVQAEHLTAASNRTFRIVGLVEKPPLGSAPSRLGVYGRYVLESTIWDAIQQTSPDALGEIQLTDALNLLCKQTALFGFCFEGQHYDAGDRLGYLKANIELSLRDPLLRGPCLEYLSHVRTHCGD